MLERDILDNANVRKDLLDNNKSLIVIEEYKHIETIKDKVDYLTIQQVSEYFNVGYEGIRSLISRHKEELIENGLLILSGKETKEFFLPFGMNGKNIKGGFIIDDFKFANRLNYLVDKRCLLNIAMLLTESEVAKGIRSKLLDIAMGVVEGNIVATDNNSKELIDSFKSQIDFLMEQIKIKDKQIETLENLLNKIDLNNNTKPLIENKTEDKVENEILNFENSFMSIKEFSEYLNSKSVVPKKLGVLILHQLLRDNNLFDKDNNPLQLKYFKMIDRKVFLTKEGMVATYKLAKEQVTVDYMVRRGY